jgi:flagellar hook protein FlgE
MRDAMGIDVEADTPDTPFPAAGNITLVNGKITIQSNLGEENAIEVPLTAFRLTPTGSSAPQTLPLSFSETQEANGPGTSTELIVYDSLGLPLKVRITTTLETKNPNSTVYRWYATSADSEPLQGVSTVVGDGLLEFDSNGDLVSAQQNVISVQRNTTASESPLAVELDFSRIKALGETDAQGNPVSTMNVTSQDGFPPGVMTDFIITDDGTIQGQFSNGTQRVIGQIVMARFANNSGLQQVGDSLFNVGVNSGEPIFGTPGQEGIGTLTSGAVELSNTDIGQNLIELILASTQYRSGARVITAAQELLDELLALRR